MPTSAPSAMPAFPSAMPAIPSPMATCAAVSPSKCTCFFFQYKIYFMNGVDQDQAVCDIWLGLGEPSTYASWGCYTSSNVPIHSVCTWDSLSCDSCNNIIGWSTSIQSLGGTISPSIGQLTTLTALKIWTQRTSSPCGLKLRVLFRPLWGC